MEHVAENEMLFFVGFLPDVFPNLVVSNSHRSLEAPTLRLQPVSQGELKSYHAFPFNHMLNNCVLTWRNARRGRRYPILPLASAHSSRELRWECSANQLCPGYSELANYGWSGEHFATAPLGEAEKNLMLYILRRTWRRSARIFASSPSWTTRWTAKISTAKSRLLKP